MIPMPGEYKTWTEMFLPPMRWEVVLKGTDPKGATVEVTIDKLCPENSEDSVFRFKEEFNEVMDGSSAYLKLQSSGDFYGSIFLEGRMLRKENGTLFEIRTSDEPKVVEKDE